jgi:hypothetical protein
MSKTETYNGWANYETWRVHLEFFEGMDPHELRDQLSGMSLYEIGQHAKDTVAQFIEDVLPDKDNRGQLTPAGMVRGWALSFTDAADWREIAEHLAEAAGIEPTT